MPWVNDFIQECVAFPNGTHDDQVDAMTQMLLRWNAPRGRRLLFCCSDIVPMGPMWSRIKRSTEFATTRDLKLTSEDIPSALLPSIFPNESMPSDGQGFLLGWLDAVTGSWVSRVSLVSIPPLRPKGEQYEGALQRNRDIFVSTMFSLSVGSFFAVHVCRDLQMSGALRWVSAFAIYRAFDLALTVTRIGVFSVFRGDVRLAQAPTWRIQRILVGVLLNYVELVFWYSLIYFDLTKRCAQQFQPEIKNLEEAFTLSFSTMTTVGYGMNTPHSMASNLFAFAQSLTGIILLANAVGSLVSILTSRSAPVTHPPVDETPQLSWIRPIGFFALIYAVIWWLVGRVTCA